MTTLTLTGNTTEQPELRFSQSGKAWVTFTIAENHKDKDGNDKPPTFVRCKAFGSLAENIGESIGKGTRVVAVGRLQTETWEKDGERRSQLVLTVDSLGPDLRWATATVKRTNTSNSSAPASPAASDGWGSTPATDEPPF